MLERCLIQNVAVFAVDCESCDTETVAALLQNVRRQHLNFSHELALSLWGIVRYLSVSIGTAGFCLVIVGAYSTNEFIIGCLTSL